MITTVACPHCKADILIPAKAHQSDLLCQGCNARFRATSAVLRAATVRLQEARSNLESSYYIYDLRIAVQGSIQPLEVKWPAGKKPLSFMQDDELLLLHTVKGRRLALIENLTCGWKAPFVDSPFGHAATLALMVVLTMALGYSIGELALQKFLSEKYASFAGMGLAAPVAAFMIKKRRRPYFIETDEREIERLARAQSLLLEQRKTQEKLEIFQEQKRHNSGLLERFTQLQEQVVRLNLGDQRLEILARGKALVQEQEVILQKLISGYEQNQIRAEIETSASQLTEALPEGQIFDNMAELERLERKHGEIAAQIDAVAV
ncbi:MAG: hypothetical protein MH252_01835 [Thermosynechococcaceae cyanobacterium MS004]|nr:hypothetical protein [Thermosynechococcaceae cyanobacterium MS004]